MQTSVVRSATSTACRSTSTSSSTAASCPTPTGWRSCGRSPGDTGPRVRRRQPETPFLAKLADLFGLLLPAYVKEGKSYLSIAVGCTGGNHRSVYIAEELAKLLEKRGFRPRVSHRDLGK